MLAGKPADEQLLQLLWGILMDVEVFKAARDMNLLGSVTVSQSSWHWDGGRQADGCEAAS